MNLDEWRKAQKGEAFTTPSGLDVTLKRADLLDMAAQGSIPTPLASAANRLLNAGMLRIDVEKLPDYMDAVDLVVKACMVDPELEDITELPAKDRMAIYNWASGGAAQLAPFRGKAGEPADAA